MKSIVISMPKFISESLSYTLMERLEKVFNEENTVELDAKDVVWISPFGTIVLADFALKRLRVDRRVTIQMPTNTDTAAYVRNSGLLRLTTSTTISDAMDKENVQLRLLNGMEPLVPELLSAFIISQSINVGDDEKYLLRTWITELLTNANDHASSDSGFWVCGRYNPSNRDIRICVADSGIGIRQSLVNSEKLPKNISHANAIKKALEEGMTSRKGKTGGLGLKHISSYVKSHGGSMTILSGTGRLYLARKTNRIRPYHKNYQGTIVNVMLYPSSISSNGRVPAIETPFNFG